MGKVADVDVCSYDSVKTELQNQLSKKFNSANNIHWLFVNWLCHTFREGYLYILQMPYSTNTANFMAFAIWKHVQLLIMKTN